MKLPLILALATVAAAQAQDRPRFVPRMSTLTGASLQPAQGLHAAAGLENADGQGGRAIVRRPMTEEEWRAIFPKRSGQK